MAVPDEGPDDSLIRTYDAISELPESTSTVAEVKLGPIATACVARWAWKTTRDVSKWVAAIEDARLRKTYGLDAVGVVDAVTTLTPGERAKLFTYLEKSKDKLWSRVRLALSAEFDRDGWYKDAEQAAGGDDSLIVPLLTGCLEDGRIEDGIRIAERALQRTDWPCKNPRAVRTEILTNGRHNDAAVLALTAALARRAGDTELVAAAEIQALAAREPFNWDALTKIFPQWQTASSIALHASWINEVASAPLQRRRRLDPLAAARR